MDALMHEMKPLMLLTDLWLRVLIQCQTVWRESGKIWELVIHNSGQLGTN